MEWKNTPRPSGFSPAQLMFGRAQKTAMPRLGVTHARIDYELAEEDRVNRDLAMKKTFDSGSRALPPLKIGDKVVMQDKASKKWTREGQVKEVDVNERSYVITFPDGGELRRNQRFLRKV